MRAVLLGLVLAGCTQPRIKVVCPALHPWTAKFEKNMAAEIRAHRSECPSLIDGVAQFAKVRSECSKIKLIISIFRRYDVQKRVYRLAQNSRNLWHYGPALLERLEDGVFLQYPQ